MLVGQSQKATPGGRLASEGPSYLRKGVDEAVVRIMARGNGHIVRLAEIKGPDERDGDAVFDPPGHIIFHNAPAKPGFSGGPLVNEAGDVVGVDYTFSEDLGYGQSIPTEDLVRFLAPLSTGRDIAYIGVRWKWPGE